MRSWTWTIRIMSKVVVRFGTTLLALAFTAPAFSACPAPLAPPHFETRCTGKSVVYKDKTYLDCATTERPSKPMNAEILRILEQLRCEFGDRFVVTSAYRSDQHNLYSWAYLARKTGDEKAVSVKSQHVDGRALDFYVSGLDFEKHLAIEKRIHEIAGNFDSPRRGSSEKAWTKVYRSQEGRDPDNLHGFPYVHMELRK